VASKPDPEEYQADVFSSRIQSIIQEFLMQEGQPEDFKDFMGLDMSSSTVVNFERPEVESQEKNAKKSSQAASEASAIELHSNDYYHHGQGNLEKINERNHPTEIEGPREASKLIGLYMDQNPRASLEISFHGDNSENIEHHHEELIDRSNLPIVEIIEEKVENAECDSPLFNRRHGNSIPFNKRVFSFTRGEAPDLKEILGECYSEDTSETQQIKNPNEGSLAKTLSGHIVAKLFKPMYYLK
jgi:hypothetical protein